MNKKEIVKALLQQREEKIANKKRALEEERSYLKEASGPVSTDPENEKRHHQEMIKSITEDIERCESFQEKLKTVPTKSTRTVSLGSLVTLESSESREDYFIIQSGGGCSVEINGKKITCLSLKSPLVQAILELKKGAKVYSAHDRKCYKIVSVQ